MKLKSAFYTTLGEFSNCGSILDFLKEDCEYLSYLDLKTNFRKDADSTFLYLFSKGSLIGTYKLFTLPVNFPKSLFSLQHVIFLLNILQSLYLVYKNRSGKCIELVVTTFSFYSLASLLAKTLGLCKKTLLWNWDYLPYVKGSKMPLSSRLVGLTDRFAFKYSDYVWYASRRQLEARTLHGQVNLPMSNKHQVVRWGNNSKITHCKKHRNDLLRVLFMGSILPEKGLLEVLQGLPELIKLTGRKVHLTIAGEANNPEYKEFLQKFIKENHFSDYVSFFGYAKGDAKDAVLLDNEIGGALYPKKTAGIENYAYYSDPAKLRDYISFGLPIITTEVPEISSDLAQCHASIIVESLTPEGIYNAVKKYLSNPQKYLQGAYDFSKTDNFIFYYRRNFDALI